MSAAGSRTWNSTSSAINQYVRYVQRRRAATQQAAGVVDHRFSPAADGMRAAMAARGACSTMRACRIGAESQRARYVLRRSPRHAARDAARSARPWSPARQCGPGGRCASHRAPDPRPPGTSAGWRAPRLAVPPCASWPGRAHPDNQTPPAIDRGRPSPAWPAAPRPPWGHVAPAARRRRAARAVPAQARRHDLFQLDQRAQRGFLDAAHRAGGAAQRDGNRQRFLVVQQQRRQGLAGTQGIAAGDAAAGVGRGSPARAACRYPAAACADAPPASWPAPDRSSGCGFAAATAGAAGGGGGEHGARGE